MLRAGIEPRPLGRESRVLSIAPQRRRLNRDRKEENSALHTSMCLFAFPNQFDGHFPFPPQRDILNINMVT